MNYEIKSELEAILRKLKKRDPVAFQGVINKIKEITNGDNPDHYKSLRYDLKNKKRVHIKGSFVLIFSYDAEKQMIYFLDYDHHDKIYKK